MGSPQHRDGSALPPPPAPPARDANPWKLSETGQVAHAAAPSRYRRLLEELEKANLPATGEAGDEPLTPVMDETPADDTGRKSQRSGFSLFPVIVVLVMFASVAREMFESGGGDRETLMLAGAGLFVLVLAVGAYAAMRAARKRGSGDPGI